MLDIEADEAWSVLVEMATGAIAAVQINYLERPARRDFVLTTRQSTMNADLVAGTLMNDGREERFEIDRDGTYREMHLAALHGDHSVLCTSAEGARVVDLIVAIEAAANSVTDYVLDYWSQNQNIRFQFDRNYLPEDSPFTWKNERVVGCWSRTWITVQPSHSTSSPVDSAGSFPCSVNSQTSKTRTMT
jgi:hypothetical protein